MQGIPSRSMLFGAISLIIVVGAYAFPSLTHAQVYPFGPGPVSGPGVIGQSGAGAVSPVSSCTAPSIHSFTPHVYEGELHSFDYFIDNQPGTRYLPLGTTINGKAVDLNYVSVWGNTGVANRVKIHVDVPFEDLNGPVSIGVSVLQITNGPPPICPTTAAFSVTLPYSTPAPSVPSTPGTPSTPATPTTPSQPQQPQQPQTPTQPTTPGTTTNSGSPIGGGEQCTELSLWWLLALIILDILISAALLLFMSFIVKTNARLIAAVLIPPLVFIGLWYFLNTCHTNIWFPIIAVLLGIGVLTASGSPETFDPMRDKVRNWWRKMRESMTPAAAPKRTTALVIPPAPQRQEPEKPSATPPINLPGEKAGEQKREEK